MQQGGCSFKKMANLSPYVRGTRSTDNTAGKILWPLAVSGEMKGCLVPACQLKSMGQTEPVKALLQQFAPLLCAMGSNAACALVASSSSCCCSGRGWTTPAWEGAAAKAATLQNFPVGRRGVGFILYATGRDQEAATLLFIFCSWQRALSPGWDTVFIILRKTELICCLDFHLSLFLAFAFCCSVLLVIFAHCIWAFQGRRMRFRAPQPLSSEGDLSNGHKRLCLLSWTIQQAINKASERVL